MKFLLASVDSFTICTVLCLVLQRPGDCECKEGYGGPTCQECAFGYYGYPYCKPCPCNSAGTLSSQQCSGNCVCKVTMSADSSLYTHTLCKYVDFISIELPFSESFLNFNIRLYIDYWFSPITQIFIQDLQIPIIELPRYSFWTSYTWFFRRMLRASNVTGVSGASLTFTRTILWAACRVSVSECPLSVSPLILVSSRFVYIEYWSHCSVWTLTQKFTVSEIQCIKFFGGIDCTW